MRQLTVRIAAASLAILTPMAAIACDDDDNRVGTARGDRPSVTITAFADRLNVPAELPDGFVDVRFVSEPGSGEHQLVVARLNDGVTLDQALSAGPAAFTSVMKVKGGTATVDAGAETTITLELEKGSYFALDNPQNPKPVVQQFAVVVSGQRAKQPSAKGVVRLGPGMVIDVPEDFDGTGRWEFVNEDPSQIHEAFAVRLADGKTAADVATWAHGGFQGPEPFAPDHVDGMGAIGPGQRAWITMKPGAPGRYVMVCFVPGADEIPHLAQGMLAEFTVE